VCKQVAEVLRLAQDNKPGVNHPFQILCDSRMGESRGGFAHHFSVSRAPVFDIVALCGSAGPVEFFGAGSDRIVQLKRIAQLKRSEKKVEVSAPKRPPPICRFARFRVVASETVENGAAAI
jgi:hypothetical protein